MQYLDAGAGRLAYHDSAPDRSDRPVVLALHSSAASGRQWRGLAARLTPRWRLLAPDLIGYGETPMAGAGGLDDELALLAALADRIDGPFHLVGHSYGGAMALELARRRPQQVLSLAIYEPVSFALLRARGPEAAWDEISRLARRHIALVEAGDPAAAAAAFLDYWIGPGALRTMPPELQHYIAGCMRKVAAEWRSMFALQLEPDHFAALTMPVLLVSGSETTLAARSVAETLVPLLADLRWTVQPGLGHMAPVSQPDRINRLLEDFLTEMDSRPAVSAA